MKRVLRGLVLGIMAAGILSTAGCSVVREQSTVGEYVDDATITNRIRAKFIEDKTVSFTALGVETLKGVVQLTGFAKTAAEKARAEALTKSIPGVKAVKNDIVVRP